MTPHSLHWNVAGISFKQVLEYLETLYDGFADVLDNMAKPLKMRAVQPLALMKDYLTAALYLARTRYRVVAVEKDHFGGQVTVTADVVNYPGVDQQRSVD